MENEIWKDVVGYEGLYKVSSLGNIRSMIIDEHRRGRILKSGIGSNGYRVVALWKNCEKKDCLVHRLVAIAFIENPLNKRTVNHKNGNKLDNNLSNLEWMTDGENNKHSYDFLNRKKYLLGLKGEKNHNSIPIRQLDLNGNLIKTFPCITEAERLTGIRHENICKVAKGKRKTTGGYIWEYER